MRGRVASDGREAMLPLTVIGSSGILAEVEATVDTGSLCLPPDVVRYLSVPFIGRASPCSPTGALWRSATTGHASSGSGTSVRFRCS